MRACFGDHVAELLDAAAKIRCNQQKDASVRKRISIAR